MDTISDLEAGAAEAFDPARLAVGLGAAMIAIAISAIVLWALWNHLRPLLGEILGPPARRLAMKWTRTIHGSSGAGAPWLCVPCRSYNDGRHVHCYRCKAARPEVEGTPPVIN